jgi:hypothetical protein
MCWTKPAGDPKQESRIKKKMTEDRGQQTAVKDQRTKEVDG